MSGERSKLALLISGPLVGQFPALPLYLTLHAIADCRGRIVGMPARIRALTGWPDDLFEQGLHDLQQVEHCPRFPEEADGYVSVTSDGGLMTILLPSYRRYAENQRPVLTEWAAIRTSIFERDDYTCVYCGARGDLHCDHVIPVSKGGGHEPENLVTACETCNRSKRAKWLHEWRPDLVERLSAMGITTGSQYACA